MAQRLRRFHATGPRPLIAIARRFSAALAVVLAVIVAVAAGPAVHTQSARPRARALGVPFTGVPDPLNAITDVAGVEVGHTTIVSGGGPLVVGQGRCVRA